MPQEPRTLAICMFAKAPPHALEAVTNGVRVRVSSIFIPEHSRELPPRYFFAYRCAPTSYDAACIAQPGQVHTRVGFHACCCWCAQ